MNVTVRASLIALIAIVWRLLGNPRPPGEGRPTRCRHDRHDDAGSTPCSPATAITLGLLAANFREDALLGTRSARNRTRTPVSPRGRGQPDLAFHGVAYTAIGYAAMGLRTWTTARQHR